MKLLEDMSDEFKATVLVVWSLAALAAFGFACVTIYCVIELLTRKGVL